MQTTLFCYGTLTVPRLMAAVIGRRVAPRAAALTGYRAATLRGRPYPGLWPDPDGRVDGCCYRIGSRRELLRADRYEGREYRRQRVVVETADGPCDAWVYVLRRGRARVGRRWSRRDFERRALRRYLRHITAWHARVFAEHGGGGA